VRALPLLLLTGALTGCPTEPEPEPEPIWLVDHHAWEYVEDPADDPLDDRPDPIECLDTAWSYEFIGEGSLELRTIDCNYLAVRQPALTDVAAGEELHVRLWHHELTAADPAEAHAAIVAQGEVIWEIRHDIPGDSGMDAPTWAAEEDIDAGDEIVFHLHNHGTNTWNFIELSVLQTEAR